MPLLRDRRRGPAALLLLGVLLSVVASAYTAPELFNAVSAGEAARLISLP